MASLFLGLTTAGLYTCCTHQAEAYGELTQTVAFLEQKTRKRTEEKDIYKIKLVLSEKRKQAQEMNISKGKQGGDVTKS